VYCTACPLDTCVVVEPENDPQLPGLPQLSVNSAPPEAIELESAIVKRAAPPVGRVSAVGVTLIREGRIVKVAVPLMLGSLTSAAVICTVFPLAGMDAGAV
jgi:hypothetical protein